MKIRIIIMLMGFIIMTMNVNAQKQKIKEPKRYQKNCKRYVNSLKRLSGKGRPQIFLEGTNAYLYFNNAESLKKIFKKRKDGLFIDVVTKNQFDCNQPNPSYAGFTGIGKIWKVLFKKDLRKLKNISDNPYKLLLDLGPLPPDFDYRNQECNLGIIQKKYSCDYRYTHVENGTNWDLIEMGYFKDSLKAKNTSEIYSLNYKDFQFIIPYEKNQSVIDQQVIDAIHDSLNFTDYNIVSINVLAFASVEGNTEHNRSLVQKRSKSVIDALQKYQNPEITYQIDAVENWDEFYRDVSKTKYAYLKKRSKQDIKFLLKSRNEQLNQLEPMLKKHRKAILSIQLSRKTTIQEMNNEELVKFFNVSVKNEDLEEVKALEEIIFDRTLHAANPDSLLSQLEIPQEVVFSPLHNNLVLHRYQQAAIKQGQLLQAFEQLQILYPKNQQILYNLMAANIKEMLQNITPDLIDKNTKVLRRVKSSKLSTLLKARLDVNWNLILADYYAYLSKYKDSQRHVRNIAVMYRKYKNTFSQEELLNLAKFLAKYEEYDLAERLLKSELIGIDVSEEYLFFYLKITISNSKYKRKKYYSDLVKQALIKNRKKFCTLFNAKGDKGLTFQLLSDPYLKDIYCQECL